MTKIENGTILDTMCPSCIEEMFGVIKCASEAIEIIGCATAIGEPIDWLAVVGSLQEATDLANGIAEHTGVYEDDDPARSPDRE